MTWKTKEELVSSQAIKADKLSTFSATISDATKIALVLNVTASPMLETSVRVMRQISLDGTTWSKEETAGVFSVVKETGNYATIVDIDYPYVRLGISSLNWGLTASLTGAKK